MATVENQLRQSYNSFCRLTEEIVVVIPCATGEKPVGYGHRISLSARKQIPQSQRTPKSQRICLQCRRPQFDSWVRKIPWRKDRLLTPVFLSFPCGLYGKECTYNMGDLDSIPGLGRSPGEGKDYPLLYSGLENSMDYIVHGVAKSQTQLSILHFHQGTFH